MSTLTVIMLSYFCYPSGVPISKVLPIVKGKFDSVTKNMNIHSFIHLFIHYRDDLRCCAHLTLSSIVLFKKRWTAQTSVSIHGRFQGHVGMTSTTRGIRLPEYEQNLNLIYLNATGLNYFWRVVLKTLPGNKETAETKAQSSAVALTDARWLDCWHGNSSLWHCGKTWNGFKALPVTLDNRLPNVSASSEFRSFRIFSSVQSVKINRIKVISPYLG